MINFGPFKHYPVEDEREEWQRDRRVATQKKSGKKQVTTTLMIGDLGFQRVLEGIGKKSKRVLE